MLGIGINVKAASLPHADQLTFPATSLETELGHPLEQVDLLRELLTALRGWRSKIGGPDFLRAWEEALAFRNQPVLVGRDGEPQLSGTLLGLEPDGSLRLMADDMPTIVHFGEIHLRPSNDRIG